MPTTQTGAPLSAAHFRVNAETSLATIATQTRVIVFHFALKELSLKINQDANPQTFLDVAQFALHPTFTVDLLDAAGNVALTLGLVNAKLITHDFPLEFTPVHDAFHTFRFSYESVRASTPAGPITPVVAPVTPPVVAPVAPVVAPVITPVVTPVIEPTVVTNVPTDNSGDVVDIVDIPDAPAKLEGPDILELDAPLPPEHESRVTPDHPDHNG